MRGQQTSDISFCSIFLFYLVLQFLDLSWDLLSDFLQSVYLYTVVIRCRPAISGRISRSGSGKASAGLYP